MKGWNTSEYISLISQQNSHKNSEEKKKPLLRINIPYILYFGSQYFNINWINHILSVQPGCSSPDNVHFKAECSALLITSLFGLRVNANYQVNALSPHRELEVSVVMLNCKHPSISTEGSKHCTPSVLRMTCYASWQKYFLDWNSEFITVHKTETQESSVLFFFHHSIITLQQNITWLYQNSHLGKTKEVFKSTVSTGRLECALSHSKKIWAWKHS